MADFKPQPRPKNILDSKRINLSTKCPVKGVDGWSTLYFYANNDNPGITVYTGDPNDKDNNFGRIQAKFSYQDMMTLLEVMDMVIRSKEPIKAGCVCKSTRGQDKRQIDAAYVEIGKNPGGVMYIMVEDLERQGRPKIYFPFAPSRFHHFQINGEPVSEAQMSCLVANGWYKSLQRLVSNVSDRTYKHPEPKNGGNGGGGYKGGGNKSYGGGGNRGGGGGNYGNDADSDTSNSFGSGAGYDDDMPF